MSSLSATLRPNSWLLLSAACLVSSVLWLATWSLANGAVTQLVKANFDLSRGVARVSGWTLLLSASWIVIAGWLTTWTLAVSLRSLMFGFLAVMVWVFVLTGLTMLGLSSILDHQLVARLSSAALWSLALTLWTVELTGAVLAVWLFARPMSLSGMQGWLWLVFVSITSLLASRVLLLSVVPNAQIAL